MKKFFLILGVVIVLVALSRGIMYIHDYHALNEAQKELVYDLFMGNIIGSVLLLALGGVAIYFGLRKKKTGN